MPLADAAGAHKIDDDIGTTTPSFAGELAEERHIRQSRVMRQVDVADVSRPISCWPKTDNRTSG